MKKLLAMFICVFIGLASLPVFADPSLTDAEKLEACKQAFYRKLDSIDDWNQFKNLVKNISPTMVKNFLKNRLEEQEQEASDESSAAAVKSVDFGDLADEVDNLQ